MIYRRSHKENDSSKSKNAKDKNQGEELGGTNAHIEDTQRLDIEIEMLQKLYCIWWWEKEVKWWANQKKNYTYTFQLKKKENGRADWVWAVVQTIIKEAFKACYRINLLDHFML